MFTRVLKGHIAVDSQVFPEGTAGCLLDTLSRQHLWAVGKNFLHGESISCICEQIFPFCCCSVIQVYLWRRNRHKK
jgi:Xaa-Pro aminopeptidase